MSRASKRVFSEKTPCIYFIRNQKTREIYIGSTFDFDRRINEHIRKLSIHRNHKNYKLQEAWLRDKTEGFNYGVLEYLPKDVTNDELRKTEQLYLDKIKPAYNISPSATRNTMSRESAARASEREAKTYVIVEPNGKEYQIKNLTKFCKDHGLSENGMRSVAGGLSSNHRGWKCWRPENGYRYVNKHTKQWIVTSPDGKEEKIMNLSAFCKKNGLQASCMQSVAYGEVSQHRGWKCSYA